MPLHKPVTRRLILIAIDTSAVFRPEHVGVSIKRPLPAGTMMSIGIMDFQEALRSAVDRQNHELGGALIEMRDELDRHAGSPR